MRFITIATFIIGVAQASDRIGVTKRADSVISSGSGGLPSHSAKKSEQKTHPTGTATEAKYPTTRSSLIKESRKRLRSPLAKHFALMGTNTAASVNMTPLNEFAKTKAMEYIPDVSAENRILERMRKTPPIITDAMRFKEYQSPEAESRLSFEKEKSDDESLRDGARLLSVDTCIMREVSDEERTAIPTLVIEGVANFSSSISTDALTNTEISL